MAVARVGVDFVPPPQTDEATARDVLEVVEVDGEEDEGEDENEDTVKSVEQLAWVGRVGLGTTNKFLMKSTPKRYMSRLPVEQESVVSESVVGKDCSRGAIPVRKAR